MFVYSVIVADDDPRLKVTSTLNSTTNSTHVSNQEPESTLIIEPVQKEDFAVEYCCVFGNERGRGEKCVGVRGK